MSLKHAMERLYFGDNLEILREHIPEASVDLIYLDPPFNCKRDYNLIFKCPKGHASDAQITAFEDSWHWNGQAEREYHEVLHQPNTRVAEMLQAFRSFLGENDMMAYLTMMTNRLLELHRALKPTGSLYLHCDPTASHYLKVVLDGVFGEENHRNEIVWQRTNAHNTAGQYGRVHDVLLFYSKTKEVVWNSPRQPYSDKQLKRYKIDSSTGKLFTSQDLTASRPNSRSGKFEWRGTRPPESRGWGYTLEQLEAWWGQGRILCKRDGTPRMDGLIVYLDKMPGKPLHDVWTDIPRIPNTSAERLGYPTQKPLALLERIIRASSNEGDVVLDPFAGCGTAVHAAHKLKRRWVGIDITHLAIALVERRLKVDFPGLQYEVIGTPKDLEGARSLAERDKYQFQWWACSLVNAQPYQGRKKGPDGGVDGIIFFQDDRDMAKKIVVSVKGGEHINAAMIRDLKGVIERERAAIGVFLTLARPSQPMRAEAAAAGFYSSPAFNTPYPKLQIVTVEGALNGTEQVRYPDLSGGGLTFKKAAREKHPPAQQTLLPGI